MMGPKLALVGATGLVGRVMLEIIARERAKLSRLGLYASTASAGSALPTLDREQTVAALAECDFSQYDVAFFCVGDELSKQYVPQALEAGCAVIDKSNAYRLDPGVPLVVPGVNDAAVNAEARLIANPNCTTIVLVHALAPIHRRFGLRRLFVATYQSVSGAGKGGVAKLMEEAGQRARLHADTGYIDVQPAEIAFNVHAQIGGLDELGRSEEEVKLIEETKKILAGPEMVICCHAARVPVYVGHALAVTVELEREAAREELIAAWEEAPDLLWQAEQLPTPVGATGHERVEVGRLRPEPQLANGWSFFACGDNLRIGAALNGWRILKLLQAARVVPGDGGAEVA